MIQELMTVSFCYLVFIILPIVFMIIGMFGWLVQSYIDSFQLFLSAWLISWGGHFVIPRLEKVTHECFLPHK
jgi:hypothetical protein